MRRELSPAAERFLNQLQGESEPTLALAFSRLLADDEGQPAQLLSQYEILAQELIEEVGSSNRLIEVEQLISQAQQIAQANFSDTITTEHFMLAAVEELLNRPIELHSREALLRLLKVRVRTFEDLVTEQTESADFLIDDPMSLYETQRIIDVNLNRSFESLRVLDDYCRFVLNDRHWTETIKTTRHSLATIVAETPKLQGRLARDTLHDVGINIQGSRESSRQSPRQVAEINFRRLQESLRSLEEYGKILDSYFARRIEQLRYESYTFESGLSIAADAKQQLANVSLCLLVSARQCVASLEWTIEQAIRGGVGMVQIREKEIDDRTLLERAKRVRKVTRDYGAILIVNDRPDIARIVDADGAHVGQDDLPIQSVRSILGIGKIVGLSSHNPQQLENAIKSGADYLGIGPVFPSKTKSFSNHAGIEFVHHAVAITTTPTFAIGGIQPGNVNKIAAAGCRKIAVSAAICQADDPEQVARSLIEGLNPSQNVLE